MHGGDPASRGGLAESLSSRDIDEIRDSSASGFFALDVVQCSSCTFSGEQSRGAGVSFGVQTLLDQGTQSDPGRRAAPSAAGRGACCSGVIRTWMQALSCMAFKRQAVSNGRACIVRSERNRSGGSRNLDRRASLY